MTKQDFESKILELRKNYLNTAINDLEYKYRSEYVKLFKELYYDLNNRIKKYKDDMGNIRAIYLNQIKEDLKKEINKFYKRYKTTTLNLLEESSFRAFENMKEIYFKVGMENLVEHIKWNKNIMDYLISYKAQDGLTISERLWGHSKQIRDKIFDSLKKNILAGESVWDTMMELQEIKSPKIKIPEYLKKEFEKMSYKKIEEVINLYTVKKTNYLTRRLVEAEIERAYRTTTLKLAENKEWIKGMKWNLSHKHKYGVYDCNCEKNATQNAFGLGRGVYPIKYYPPAPDHPWCNCFETEVFDEKVLEDYGIIDKKDKNVKNKEFEKIPPKEYISKKYNIKTKFGKTDEETIKTINSAFDKMHNEFGDSMDNILDEISFGNFSSAYAKYELKYQDDEVYRTLKISKIFKNKDSILRALERDIKANFHPEGANSEFIIAHEIGHALEMKITRKEKNFFNVWKSNKLANKIRDEALKNLGIDPTDYNKVYKYIKNELGKYATEDSHELIAQAIANGVTSKNPSKLSLEILKIIKRELKK
ncbi:hypothetical protein [Marinitoga lauensis]|uniref:hypothetical protein n=1 Tax=Marinitoga lauensis TaxID=2201189 RepID=UPI001013AD6E|nr:hypothetical protein [Marinitoga lauensis]